MVSKLKLAFSESNYGHIEIFKHILSKSFNMVVKQIANGECVPTNKNQEPNTSIIKNKLSQKLLMWLRKPDSWDVLLNSKIEFILKFDHNDEAMYIPMYGVYLSINYVSEIEENINSNEYGIPITIRFEFNNPNSISDIEKLDWVYAYIRIYNNHIRIDWDGLTVYMPNVKIL